MNIYQNLIIFLIFINEDIYLDNENFIIKKVEYNIIEDYYDLNDFNDNLKIKYFENKDKKSDESYSDNN